MKQVERLEDSVRGRYGPLPLSFRSFGCLCPGFRRLVTVWLHVDGGGSGALDEVYRYHGLDTDSIIRAGLGLADRHPAATQPVLP